MTKKFGFGFGYCAYCGLKAKSLVILCNSITTQPKVTPTNHHLLIDIHHCRFSLGHQGLPRLPQALRNHKKDFTDMVKEEEREKKPKVPHGVENDVFPTVA